MFNFLRNHETVIHVAALFYIPTNDLGDHNLLNL